MFSGIIKAIKLPASAVWPELIVVLKQKLGDSQSSPMGVDDGIQKSVDSE